MKVLKSKHFYKSMIFLIYFLFFLSISFTGNFKIFVKKFYFPYIIIGILILLSLLLAEIKKLKRFKETSFFDILTFCIFLFPLILLIIVKPTTLPTYTALKRGIQTEFLTQDVLKSLQEKIEIEGKYKKLTIKQVLGLAKSKPEQIDGKDIIVEGMVYKNERKFMLVRFLITCCAADATPLGIEIEYKENGEKEEIRNDDWVKVRGKVKIENDKVKIIAEEIIKTELPSNPYLY
ncbi:MAG: TIGR03943 family protein [Candidatus Omnitrophica bacterium]|nr:TIGR03943 family protein [Candidatus Omnitrophota bacterium]